MQALFSEDSDDSMLKNRKINKWEQVNEYWVRIKTVESCIDDQDQ